MNGKELLEKLQALSDEKLGRSVYLLTYAVVEEQVAGDEIEIYKEAKDFGCASDNRIVIG